VVKGKQPYDREQFLHNAKLVAAITTISWETFLFPGSDKGDTRLKSAALKDKDKFLAAAHNTRTQAAKLAEIAKGGDLKAIKTQFGMVGKNCGGGCHKPFRS
jgi:cytochrome c556